MEIIMQLALLVVGFLMLVKGADWFVEGSSKIADKFGGSSKIADKFGIPQLVIGLTIVAMGTSAPEAAVSITSALKGSAEITIGNILGSNILNVLIILGLTAFICVIPVQRSTVRYEIPFAIGVSVLLGVLGLVDGWVGFMDGVILWAFFLAYLAYLLWSTKHGNNDGDEIPQLEEKDTIPRLLFLIVVGMGLVVWGADLTVDAATALAEMFGVSQRFIGLTIVALGTSLPELVTSLPELVTSVTAGIKGKTDIAVGNIVGSNIFNILFVVGTASLITPVVYSSSFMVDSIITVASMALLWLCVCRDRKISRTGGVIMLVSYLAYFIYLVQQ